jgi:hypothetical protein
MVRTPLLWVPTAAVLVHEHLERLVQGGDLGSVLAAEPAVLAGLLLQVPCGLIALWLVRAVLRTADDLAVVLARRPAHALRLLVATLGFSFTSSPLRTTALGSRHAGRAPPVPA